MSDQNVCHDVMQVRNDLVGRWICVTEQRADTCLVVLLQPGAHFILHPRSVPFHAPQNINRYAYTTRHSLSISCHVVLGCHYGMYVCYVLWYVCIFSFPGWLFCTCLSILILFRKPLHIKLEGVVHLHHGQVPHR